MPTSKRVQEVQSTMLIRCVNFIKDAGNLTLLVSFEVSVDYWELSFSRQPMTFAAASFEVVTGQWS